MDKFWSDKLTWAFGPGELKIASLQSNCVVDISCGLKFDIHTKGIKKNLLPHLFALEMTKIFNNVSGLMNFYKESKLFVRSNHLQTCFCVSE